MSTPPLPSFLLNPLSIYEHIKTKQKINHVDAHRYLPWVLLSDKDNNIIIYDVNKKHIIRAFSLSQYLPENIVIKGIKFFDCVDQDYIKTYIDEYENHPVVKHKGIPINLRSCLIYLISDKYIFFYSYLLQNFIRFIPHKEFNNNNFITADIYDFSTLLILTDDGNIFKWNLQDWICNKEPIISKQEIGKGVNMMKVIQLLNGEKIVIICTKNKMIFKLNLNIKMNNLTRIDINSKSQHEKEVNYIDFNPNTNILITLSKTNIILYDINNISNFRKLQNFALYNKESITGIVPNLSTCFNNYSYFIYGKKCPKIFLVDLKINDLNKLDNKNFTKNVLFNLDLDKVIFRKVNDKEIKVFQITILQHLYEYLIMGTNKGLIIFKFDTNNKPALVTLSMMPSMDINKNQNYYFYNYTKDNLILEQKLVISYDKKNKLLVNSDIRKVEDNILDNSKFPVTMYDVKLNYKNNLLTCIDKVSNIYIIYQIKSDIKNSNPYSISELIKIHSGDALSFEWGVYSNNFAITKRALTNANSFLLEVYSISENNKINKIYEVKDLYSHKIFSGHFIGVILKKHGEHLQVPMKYINSYNYEISKEAELNFYYWDEDNKLNLTIKEEPLDIISSEDLQFMIICFRDKYNIYQLNELTGNLEKINTVYDHVISGIVYENIIFLYLTEFGTYFHILNKQCTFPCKLFRQSDEVNLYNLKISKKFKENKIFYEKKPKQIKILCINDNLIFTTDALGNIEVSELNHILFKIISLIRKKNLGGVTALLTFLDKKLIKYVLLIFEYYFENDEKILRKIFTSEMILNFELYNHFGFFIKDLAEVNLGKLESIIEKELINAIIKNDTKKINELYTIAEKYKLKMITKVARTINKTTYLDTLMSKKRYIESYLFNLTNKVNNTQNNENILSMALGQVTSQNNLI